MYNVRTKCSMKRTIKFVYLELYLNERKLCIVKFSDSLKVLRRKLNLTQAELASKLFLSSSVIAKYNL